MTIRTSLLFWLLAWLVSAQPGMADADEPQVLRQLAISWLSSQAAEHYPEARVHVEAGPLDARLRLRACAQLRFFLPVGAHLWGNGSLGVRCAAPTPWSLYLSYRIEMDGPALLTQRPLPARHPLGMDDVAPGRVRYAQDPAGYVREIPAGAVTLRPMQAGQPIRIQDLILPDIIQAGTRVRVHAQGQGFSVAQEGKALNAARAGAPVRVRMPSGRIVQGLANARGEVEVHP